MAACTSKLTLKHKQTLTSLLAKIPQPQQQDGQERQDETPLPQTLVRIPTEQAPMIQQHQDAAIADKENQQ